MNSFQLLIAVLCQFLRTDLPLATPQSSQIVYCLLAIPDLFLMDPTRGRVRQMGRGMGLKLSVLVSSPTRMIRSDEGLKLESSAVKPLTVANLHYQLS